MRCGKRLWGIIGLWILAMTLPTMLTVNSQAPSVDAKQNVLPPSTPVNGTTDRFHAGLAAISTQAGDGYVNVNGQFLIPAKFAGTAPFSEGLASVKILDKHGKARNGFIDMGGCFVILPQFSDTLPFSEGVARVADWLTSPGGYAVVTGRVGFIDHTGKYVIPLQFDQAESFSEGLAAASIGGKWGYIDHDGKWAIKPQYRLVGNFKEGVAYAKSQPHEKYLIDRRGDKLIETGEQILDIKNAIGEGLVPVKIRSQSQPKGKWGYANFTGKIEIPGRYENAGAFSEGLAAVWQDAKIGFIDHGGKFVIPPKYGEVDPEDSYAYSYPPLSGAFHEGVASVALNDKYGLIDSSGRVLLPFRYEFVNAASEGYVTAQIENRTYIYAVSGLLTRQDMKQQKGIRKTKGRGER